MPRASKTALAIYHELPNQTLYITVPLMLTSFNTKVRRMVPIQTSFFEFRGSSANLYDGNVSPFLCNVSVTIEYGNFVKYEYFLSFGHCEKRAVLPLLLNRELEFRCMHYIV